MAGVDFQPAEDIGAELAGGDAGGNLYVEIIQAKFLVLRREAGDEEARRCRNPRMIQERLGITDTLIRVSVGIEAVEELIEDFDRALRAV